VLFRCTKQLSICGGRAEVTPWQPITFLTTKRVPANPQSAARNELFGECVLNCRTARVSFGTLRFSGLRVEAVAVI
jgi:hypothetical protein